ncbi:MAG: hypothetical protein AAFX03_01490 [Pseudomonadota bacterium]
MLAFRLLLIAMLAILIGYTAVVIAEHGANLFPIFFGDIVKMGWAGQFNVDFSGFLILSALWTAWRYQYAPAGLGLAVLAFFGGILFQGIHLLWLSFKTGGDMKRILLGDARAAA